jgi:tripartite-type tricarboxylate transporter receptor subunit TctC
MLSSSVGKYAHRASGGRQKTPLHARIGLSLGSFSTLLDPPQVRCMTHLYLRRSLGGFVQETHEKLFILRRRYWAAMLAVICVGTTAAFAQTNKPIRIIVPFTPGGSADILARALAPKLTQSLGQTVVIENKPGAGGTLGATEAARAEPDGNTIFMAHVGTLAVSPAVYPKLNYDPLKSFVAVAWVAQVPNVLVVPEASSAKTLAEFIAVAKRGDSQLSFASGGNGSAAHVTFE